MENAFDLLNPTIWENFLMIKDKKDIFLDFQHYLLELFNWIKDNSSQFKKELLEKYRIDTILELDNVLNYIGCDAEIYLDKEIERIFKNMPETEELFLMRIGNTLWDLVRKRTSKDCPCCMADELNYVLAKTKEGSNIVLECNTCGWTEYLNGKRWEEGKAKIYPISNIEISSITQKSEKTGITTS